MNPVGYAMRALAAIYVLAWTLFATARVGDAVDGEPFTWWSVCAITGAFAVAVALGWAAREEFDLNRPDDQ